MDNQNIFVPDFVYIVPNGGLLGGMVKKGNVKVGMQAGVKGRTLEITVLQVGDKVQDEAKEGEKCGFMFVCRDIEANDIQKGEEIKLSEPKE